MGKHGNEDNQKVGGGRDYEPKHDGGRDAYEWAQSTQPKQDKPKGK